jgi:hypothetical protein
LRYVPRQRICLGIALNLLPRQKKLAWMKA